MTVPEPEPQPVLSAPTAAAIFLVVTVTRAPRAAVRDVLADVGGLGRSVGIPRAGWPSCRCVVGMGSDGVGRDLRHRRARAAASVPRRSPARATPRSRRRGDLLFHIRPAARPVLRARAAPHGRAREDVCASSTRCTASSSFDERDLLGFVDGTENPEGRGTRRGRDRRRGRRLRGRQLRRRAEVPPRPRGVGRAAGRGPGARHRPHEAQRHRVARRRQAERTPTSPSRRSSSDGEERQIVCVTTCRSAGRDGGVRHVLHRLRRAPRT